MPRYPAVVCRRRPLARASCYPVGNDARWIRGYGCEEHAERQDGPSTSSLKTKERDIESLDDT
jgi:hypothetical protein